MKKKTKIVLCTLFITLILFSVTGDIFAQINQNYGKPAEAEEFDLDGKVTNSSLANALGALVYALASLAESLVGSVFESISGDPTFPWADRVIFNSVPFLDINFFNPSSGSLFLSSDKKSSSELEGIGDSLTNIGSSVMNGTSSNTKNATMLANIVRNVYFTMLTLAIGLLSVVVGIMAIKLAISTIAAEKAKYKEAITNWLFAIIMIFTVHFAMSFIFFINEKMVEVASSLIVDKTFSIKKNYEDIKRYWNDENNSVKDFVNYSYKKGYSTLNYIDASNAIKGTYNSDYEKFKAYFLAFEAFVRENFYEQIYETGFYLSKLKDYEKIEQDVLNDNGAIKSFYNEYKDIDINSFYDYFIKLLKEREIEIDNSGNIYYSKDNEYKQNNITANKNKFELMIRGFYNFGAYANGKTGDSTQDNTSSGTISNLGKWFKESAWKKGWIFSYVTFQGALLYAIFVTQSILFFFAYTKRFFYVVILAILAPLIIIYDFLGKNM